MLLIRNHNTQVALVLIVIFSITLLPSCSYKYHSFGYETDLIQTLEAGDKVSVLMNNHQTYELQITEVDESSLRGIDKQKRNVELPLSEIIVVQKLKADSKTWKNVGLLVGLTVALVILLELTFGLWPWEVW